MWLQSRLVANLNIPQTCNAFWNGSTINFYRSGGGCGNTGEIAAIFDHEWGHGLDDNDANGVISNSSEGYADIAAIFRLQTSCVGHGFSIGTTPGACGLTADGTGPNRNENQVGGLHCDLDCSGVRDADWDKHADHTPDTALGFVCTQCGAGTGPCGRQVHCAAAPSRQAAWDLVTRDLTGAALQPRQPERVPGGQPDLLPGQRQHRRLARLHLRSPAPAAAARPTPTSSGSRPTTTTATSTTARPT